MKSKLYGILLAMMIALLASEITAQYLTNT